MLWSSKAKWKSNLNWAIFSFIDKFREISETFVAWSCSIKNTNQKNFFDSQENTSDGIQLRFFKYYKYYKTVIMYNAYDRRLPETNDYWSYYGHISQTLSKNFISQWTLDVVSTSIRPLYAVTTLKRRCVFTGITYFCRCITPVFIELIQSAIFCINTYFTPCHR